MAMTGSEITEIIAAVFSFLRVIAEPIAKHVMEKHSESREACGYADSNFEKCKEFINEIKNLLPPTDHDDCARIKMRLRQAEERLQAAEEDLEGRKRSEKKRFWTRDDVMEKLEEENAELRSTQLTLNELRDDLKLCE